MQDTLWKTIAYGLFISQTIAVIVILELLIFGRPYISLFWLILGLTVHFNFARNPDLPIARHWPFLKK